MPDELECGDVDGSGATDLADFAQFAQCVSGPDRGVASDACLAGEIPARLFDIDGDRDCDFFDMSLLTRCFGAGSLDACGADAGPCFQPHETPGCEDPVCCQEVCGIAPECCDLSWAPVCVSIASDVCGPPPAE